MRRARDRQHRERVGGGKERDKVRFGGDDALIDGDESVARGDAGARGGAGGIDVGDDDEARLIELDRHAVRLARVPPNVQHARLDGRTHRQGNASRRRVGRRGARRCHHHVRVARRHFGVVVDVAFHLLGRRHHHEHHAPHVRAEQRRKVRLGADGRAIDREELIHGQQPGVVGGDRAGLDRGEDDAAVLVAPDRHPKVLIGLPLEHHLDRLAAAAG